MNSYLLLGILQICKDILLATKYISTIYIPKCSIFNKLPYHLM